MLLTAAFCSVLAPYPMFMLVTQGTAYSIIAGIAIALVFMAAIYSAMAGYLSSAFAAPVRYSGISLSYQLCGALAGGMTPLVGTWLAFHYPASGCPGDLLFHPFGHLAAVHLGAGRPSCARGFRVAGEWAARTDAR